MDGNSDNIVQSGPDVVVGVVSCCSSAEWRSGQHNACWQNHMRAENQLFAAQQTVIALSSQLHIAEEKLVSIKDLIREVRTRMYKCGLKSHPTMRWKHQPPQPSTIGNNSPQCMYTF